MSNSKLIALAVFFCFYQSAAFADETAIDKRQNACLTKVQTTMDQTVCTVAAYDAWDTLLNSEYAGLLKELDPAQKQSLRDSQRQWLSYRDSYFKTIDSVYLAKQGTMFRPLRIQAMLEVVKSRTLQLQDLHSTISQ